MQELQNRSDASAVSTDEPDVADSRTRTQKIRSWFRTPLPYVLLAYLVFRGVILQKNGGIGAAMNYDDGVYYGAATGLANGLVPYRDFLLVHPPGIAVFFAPIAALGSVITDLRALELARLVVILIGLLNTALVYYVGKKAAGTTAAVTASLLWIVWSALIFEEKTTLLEPFVLVGILVSLALLFNTSERTWKPVVAGLVIGYAVVTKYWAAIPMLVIAGGVVVSRRVKAAVVYLVSAGVMALVVTAPFWVLAGSQMVEDTIAAQSTRQVGSDGLLERLALILNISTASTWSKVGPRLGWPLVGACLVAVALCAVAVWFRYRKGRIWVVLLVVQGAILLWVPVFFQGYASFVAPALLLTLGAGAQFLWDAGKSVAARRSLRVLAVAAVSLTVAYSIVLAALTSFAFGSIGAGATPAVAAARCVAADRPSTIAIVDKMTSNVTNGCPAVYDITGLFFEPEVRASGAKSRATSQGYQDAVLALFAASDYVIISRETADGLTPASLAVLKSRPIVYTAKGGKLVIYGPPVTAPSPNGR